MKKIKVILKNNKVIYYLYTLILSNLLKLLSIFIKIDNKTILINSFAGKKYDDSPKAIYEYIITNKKYDEYKIYWAFEEPQKYKVDKRAIVIKIDTLKYFLTALKAKYWITNSAIERGLKFKKKDTIYINTWHGSAIKKMGLDAPDNAFKFKNSEYNVMYAQSEYDIQVFSGAYNIPKENFALVGLPRNDELSNVTFEEIEKIKKNLNLPIDKKIILYAPTFREYQRDKDGCIIAPPINIELWKNKLKDNYIVLFRAHYEVNKALGIINNNFIYNFSDYASLNDLLKISDILISDYSSIMIDYAILERPIFSYAYDYEEYLEKRGMYIDLQEELPNGFQRTEQELLDKILNINDKEQIEKIKKFKTKYVEKYGNASQYIDELIK